MKSGFHRSFFLILNSFMWIVLPCFLPFLSLRRLVHFPQSEISNHFQIVVSLYLILAFLSICWTIMRRKEFMNSTNGKGVAC